MITQSDGQRCSTCRFYVPDPDVDTGARCRSQDALGFTIYPEQGACLWWSSREKPLTQRPTCGMMSATRTSNDPGMPKLGERKREQNS